MSKTRNREDFIKKLESLRPGCFNMTEVVYIKTSTDVKLTCLRCKNIVYNKPKNLLATKIHIKYKR